MKEQEEAVPCCINIAWPLRPDGDPDIRAPPMLLCTEMAILG